MNRTPPALAVTLALAIASAPPAQADVPAPRVAPPAALVLEPGPTTLQEVVDGAGDTAALGSAGHDELAALDVGDATFQELWRAIEAIVAQEALDSAALSEAMRRLASLVRLQPGILPELVATLPAASPFAADALLSSLGAAGSMPAQQALADFAADARAAPHLRQSSLDAMIQLGAPSDAVLRAVRGVVDDGDAADELRGNALLVFGALASRDPSAAGTDRAQLVADLLAREDHERAAGRLGWWLHALGNCGAPAVLPALERHAVHADKALRHAALRATCQIPGDAALGLLGRRARDEAEVSLRATAVEGLARAARGAHLEFVAGVLAQREAPELRRAAVNGLRWQVGRNDEVRPLLERAANVDPDPTVRELAQRALSVR